MKKLTLKIFAILTLFFGLLLCVSVLGCGNAAGGGNESGGNTTKENDENQIDKDKIIPVNDFWPYPADKGSFDKSSNTLILQKIDGSEAGATLSSKNLDIKGKFICFEYENPTGRFRIQINYNNSKNDIGYLDSLKTKIYVPLQNVQSGETKIDSIIFYNQGAYNKNENQSSVKIKKIYFTDENKYDKSPVIDKGSSAAFDDSISALELVEKMAVGFNLGNCYDAYQTMNDPADILWDGVDEWKAPKMSKAVLQNLADKFGKDESGKSNAKTIRIPVTWFNHIIDDEYTIDPYWMEEIKRVVDIAYKEGYYVILNSHHDVRGLDDKTHPPMSTPLKYHEGYILRDNQSDIEESKRFLKAVWTQICQAFNSSYGERLIFETMNEPRNTGDGHWGVDKNCSECLAEAKLNNEFNQLVLNTIRASGGNNVKRFVMIPNVGCDRDSGLDEVFKLPEDTAKDKLIFTVHWYPLDIGHLWKTQSWDLPNMESIFTELNKNFVEKGIPVVIGEVGPSEGNFENLVQGKSEEEKNVEALKPLSDLSKLAGKYGMSVLIFHLSELKRTINGKYLPELLAEDWKNNNKNDKEIIINDDYYIAEGAGSYDKTSQTVNLTQQYADFALTPEYEAKDKYLCIEYENLQGLLILCGIYDEGDNDYYNQGNPESSITLKEADTSAYLKMEEIKLSASKKIKIKLHRRNKDGNAQIKIKKIYFTDKAYKGGEEINEPVVDNASPVSFNNSISAINLVKDMGVGFNLGNCYEAYNSMEDDDAAYLSWDGAGYWKSYTMSKDVIKDLAAKFGTDSKGKSNAKSIRIPVTWFNHIIDDKYTIDPNWMKSVKEAVDCAYELGFYVILNSHHDVRPEMNSPITYHEGYIPRDTSTDIAESERFLKAIWEQITKAFNNSYDEHLIFETMNEPGIRHEHWGVQKGCPICEASAKLVNQYNQLVLDTIRASGGNNAKRFVLIPNVCCDFDSGLYNDVSLEADVFKMPADTAQDKLILTVHKYPMWNHLWKEEEYDYPNLEQAFENLNKNFVEKGIPVVIGEIGPTSNADINNEDSLPAKLGHILTAEEVLPPLSDLAKLAGKYGMCILDFHLSDLFLQINGKYLPEILVEDWNNQ